MPNLTSFLKSSKNNGASSKKSERPPSSHSIFGKRDTSKGSLFVVHHGEAKSPTRSPRLGFFRRNRNGKSSSNLLKAGSHSCISSTSISSCGSPLHSPSDVYTPSNQILNGLPKCSTVADFDTVRPPMAGPQKCSSLSTFCTSSEHYSHWGVSLQNSLTSLAFSQCSNKLSRSVSRCQSNLSSVLPSRKNSVGHFGPSGSGETLVLCRLCLCDFHPSEMVELKNCSCRYCKYCLQQYLMFQIMDGNVTITCPDGHCERRGEISLEEVETFVDTDTFDRYQRFLLNHEVDLDPNRTWCPRAGCETICHLATGENTSPSAISCPTCGYTFCSMCKARWHNNVSCEAYARKRAKLAPYEEGLILSDDENASIKRCPLCRIPIERGDGCAQMMCKRCKHVFCWYCLTSLDDDFLLRHYDKGPCKNKLGHSRASVFWHRTQVIGIFAGFGLLLLVASPFILLVAPCILCSHCKSCETWSEEEVSEPTSSNS